MARTATDLLTPRRFWALSFALLGALWLGGCSDDTEPLEPDSGVPEDGGTDTLKPDQGVVHKALTLKVAHINDTHAQLDPAPLSLTFKNATNQDEKINVPVGGFARIAAKIKALRAAGGNLLFVHAGDVFQGSLYFTKFFGLADAELLNTMQLDAQAVGNHEFDKGPSGLADYLDKVSFPVLAGSVDASKEPALKDKLKPYVIKTVGGEQVAVASLITAEVPTISSPGATLTFKEVVATAKALVTEIEGKGVNKIVFLTHLGHPADLELAKAVDGIDVIVGGHSHTLLGNFGLGTKAEAAYPAEGTTPKGKKVCIGTAWMYARVLGELDVAMDAQGFVTSCGGKASMLVGDALQQYDATTKKYVDVPADRLAIFLPQLKTGPGYEVIAEDATFKDAIASKFTPAIAALKAQVIAQVSDDLWHVRVPGMKHTASGQVLASGSLIAPLVAESMLWKTSSLKANIGLTDGGGVRIDIPKGNLTMGQVYELLPFGSTVFLVKVTGADVKKMLDNAVDKATATGSTGGPFPYVAGVRFTADLNQPVGSLITKLEVQEGTTWKAIDPAATYTVATTNFMAGGGDSYDVLKNATVYRYDTGFIDAETFADFATMKQTLTKEATPSVTFIPKTVP